MFRIPFNEGWQTRPKVSRYLEMGGMAPSFQDVTLPHDALIGAERSATESGAVGFFPGGVFEYKKTFTVPEEHRDRRLWLEFEGVYRDAMVYVNGDFVGQRPFGYSGFALPIDNVLLYGADNEVRVECRAHQDSRWYTGAGIYRGVHLVVGELIHIALDGVRITTPDADASLAAVEIATTIENDSHTAGAIDVITRIHDPEGIEVASDSAVVTSLPGEPAVLRQRLYVRQPQRWCVDTPYLYTVAIELSNGDNVEIPFGIRTLKLDPLHGLRINDESVKLRGACVHHDNGIIGAATIPRAEYRRVELLKQAGFNSVRSAHNPLSRAFLDACDRLGMLVMDEAFDMWTATKTDFDYALDFPEWWERDIEAMVAKDINHPSVILYSIGNEIQEGTRPSGGVWGRRLAEKIRAIDPTRPLTSGTNALLTAMDKALAIAYARVADENGDPESTENMGVNTLITVLGDVMDELTVSDDVTRQTTEAFGILDVVGMNYLEARYEMDGKAFPNRVIVGTETHPTKIDRLWRLVLDNPHVIGDFTWTGWDYLGEVAIGRMGYADEERPGGYGAVGPFPWISARAGDIDITGKRRAPSYYREIVFGLRAAPYIAVHRPEDHGRTIQAGAWSWPEVVSSWSWEGADGMPLLVDVYSDAEEIELLLDGVSLGRRPAGEAVRFTTRFETSYRPGELIALAYRGGEPAEKTRLVSASGPTVLSVTADRPVIGADPGDLAYIDIELNDRDGNLHHRQVRTITIAVDGPAELLALGNARPDTVASYSATSSDTYEGRALAVIRPTGAGEITVTASAPDCDATTIVVTAR